LSIPRETGRPATLKADNQVDRVTVHGEPIEHMGGDAYWPCGFLMGDELLRFVRSL